MLKIYYMIYCDEAESPNQGGVFKIYGPGTCVSLVDFVDACLIWV